ncbi:MAG: PEP-CTERM sorting domain-containing protein [Burkholderiaceae bacterium]|nr:PEP-CTERM sorting domain-containing protein [Burkholderiaceae bacterium]
MSNASYIARAAAALTLACSLNTAHAVLIVDTGEPFLAGSGSALMGSGDGRYHQFLAAMFTVAEGYTIDSASTHLQYSDPYWTSAGTFNFKLYGNNAGLPGTVLFSSSMLTVPVGAAGAWYSAGSLNWAIEPGSYWISLEAEESTLAILASGAGRSLPHFAFDYGTDAPGTWHSLVSSTPSLRIDATPAIPEPSTFGLMALGLAAVGVRRSIRHRQVL